MTHIEAAKQVLGELFITGFSGTSLPESTASFLSQAGIGGVILFGQNYQNPGQVASLVDQIQKNQHDLPLWISVDHEGGKVQRFREGFTRVPEAITLGGKGSPKVLFEVSEMIARELQAVGVNVNFAPVADINSNPANPVIGNRSFGDTEDHVSKMVSGFVRGHLTAGVQPCVKHFPGHGDTSVDSHFALPRVDQSLEALRAREMKPFSKAFRSGCRWVMTAHILNPNVDPDYPATLSRKTITGLLREELRFNGIIVTDDMEMKAIADHYGAEEAPRLAIEAGCDLLIYRSEAGAKAAYATLIRALEEGRLNPDRVLESAERSRALKRETLLPYEPTDPADIQALVGTPENLALLQSAL